MSGTTWTCGSSAPNPYTSTIGTGASTASGTMVNLGPNAQIVLGNANAISLGDNATITIAGGALVRNSATTAGGLYGTGADTIEVNNNSTITVQAGGEIYSSGTESNAEAINPEGSGNTIDNYGTIRADNVNAIWFQTLTGSNTVINEVGGVIQGPSTTANVMGASGNAAVNFTNEGTIIGSLTFAGGNDTLHLYTGSTITGSINGGGGTNAMTLNGTGSATLPGAINNFQTLTKQDSGTWTLTGSIGDNGGSTPLAVEVQDGALVLSGNNANFNGTMLVDPPGILQAPSQSLPPVVTDNGQVQFTQTTNGTYAGLISGTGSVVKLDSGTLTLAPTASGGNTYSGGTFFDAGTVAVGADNALGASTGGLTFNGGTLQLTNSFNLSSARPITLNAPGGTIDTNGNNTAVSQGMTGAGALTKAGAGNLVLTGSNTYSGGTTISAGTLQLGNGGTSGSITGDVADNGALTFDRTDTVTFPGTISGTGAVTQAGSGTTILNADNSYSGPTSITAGTLAVGDPSHSSAILSGGGPVTIASGATLGGFGAVSGSVTNDGTIAVGNALPAFASGPDTTFKIGGDLTNSGTLALAGATPGNTLAVGGNYSGSGGTLALSTFLNAGGPLSNQITDRLLISGNASGSTTIELHPSGPGALTGVPDAADGISIIQVAGSSTEETFSLPGGYVVGGPYQYNLNVYGPGAANGPAYGPQSLVGNAGGQWDYRLQTAYVTPGGVITPVPVPVPPVVPPPPAGVTLPPPPPPPLPPLPPDARPEVAPQVPSYVSAPVALFYAEFQDLDELHRRLGEIRDDQIEGRSDQGEMFVRLFGNTFNYTSNLGFTDFGFNFSGSYSAVQFGGNWIALNDANGTLRVGLAATLGQLWYQPSAVDGPSKGYFNAETLAGTLTWQSRAGWYVDGILAGGWFNGEVTTPQVGKASGLNGNNFGLSLEGGYPFRLGWYGLTVEPESQLVYERLGFARETDANGINLDLGNPDQGVFRAGARLLRHFTGPDGMLLTPYFEANLLQGIGGSNKVVLSNVGFTTGQFGTELEFRGGMTGTLTRNLSLYGDVAREQNITDSGFRGWAFNGGLRYDF